MNLERKVLKKKRGIGWVVASLAVGLGAASVGAQEVNAASWTANSVAEITQRLEETVKEDGVYVIQWGDTLSAISLASGITVSDLADANNIQNIDLIYAGDTLIVDRSLVADLVKNNSYVNYKENTIDESGDIQLSQVQQYEQIDDKPSQTNADLFNQLEEDVNKQAAASGVESPKPVSEDSQTELTSVKEDRDSPNKPIEKEDVATDVPVREEDVVPSTEVAGTPEQITETVEEGGEPVVSEEVVSESTEAPTQKETPESTETPETPKIPVSPEQSDEVTETVETGGAPIVSEEVVSESTETPSTEAPVNKENVDQTEELVSSGSETITEVIPEWAVVVEQPVTDDAGEPILDEDGNQVVETQLPDESTPEVVRETTIETQTKTIKPGVKYIEDNSLEVGVEKVVQEGVQGVQEIRTTTVLENGVAVNTYSETIDISTVQDKIVRIGTKQADVLTSKSIIRRTELPFKTIRRTNPNLEKGIENVIQEGVNGLKEDRYLQHFVNGKLSSEEYVDVVSEQAPVNRIIEVGTKADILDQVWDTFMPEEGDVIVRPGTINIDRENNTVSQNPDTIHRIKGVSVPEALTGKSLNDFKNDPEKDVKAADFDSGLYWANVRSTVEDSDGNSLLPEGFDYTRYGGKGMTPELVQAFNDNKTIDTTLLNQLFVNKVNEERAKHGLKPVVYETNERFNQLAEKRTEIQAVENGYLRGYNLSTGEYYGAHMLPNGKDWNSVYDQGYYVGDDYFVAGEVMSETSWIGNPYQLVSEKFLADGFYEAWHHSPDHHKALMSDYDSIVFSVKAGEYSATGGQMYAPLVGTATFGYHIEPWN